MKQATLAIMTAPQQHCCLPHYKLSSHWQTRPRDAVSTKLQAQLTLTDPRDAVSTKLQAQLTLTDPPAWRCVYHTTSSAITDRPAHVTLCPPNYKLSSHWQTRPRDAMLMNYPHIHIACQSEQQFKQLSHFIPLPAYTDRSSKSTTAQPACNAPCHICK